MANDDINRLRAEARARHEAVTKKISRLRRVNNVDVGHSKYDPRRDLSVIKRYNRNQLNSYIKSLNEFTARGNTFVGGADNTIIRGSKWREYKQLEKQFNRISAKHDAKFAQQFVPTAGMTVEQRLAQRPKGFIRAGVEASSRPFREENRVSAHIKGEEGLDKLLKRMKRQLSKGYEKSTIQRDRKTFESLAKVNGDHSLIKSMRKLNDYQFYYAWHFTNLAEAMATRYDIAGLTSESTNRGYAAVVEGYTEDAREILDYASRVSENEYTDTNARAIPVQRGREYTDTRAQAIPTQNPQGSRRRRR